MEGLNLLQNMLQWGDYKDEWKLGLKVAYFCVPLKKKSSYVRFRWKGHFTSSYVFVLVSIQLLYYLPKLQR